MDETTKVIIATLSGFIISFFAEPVKNYFQHRTKLHNLRTALYKELVSNYLLLESFSIENADANSLVIFTEMAIRIESYQYTLEHNAIEFYGLSEATAMNTLYGSLKILLKLQCMQFPTTGKVIPSEEIPKFYSAMSGVFLDAMAARAFEGRLNKRILRKLVKPAAYDELIKKGECLSKNVEQ